METHIVIGGLVAAVVVALPRVQQVDRWTNSDIHSAHTLSLLRSKTARWGGHGTQPEGSLGACSHPSQ
jgi:hypothetical protein